MIFLLVLSIVPYFYPLLYGRWLSWFVWEPLMLSSVEMQIEFFSFLSKMLLSYLFAGVFSILFSIFNLFYVGVPTFYKSQKTFQKSWKYKYDY